MTAATFQLAGDEYAVLAFPDDEGLAGGLSKDLSDAEKEVAKLLLAGRSNAEIAAARGRSVRTVANQVASIFRKLRVGSRLELAVALKGRKAR
jgi:DNA-binding CsgD family transcriptional regulator